MRTELYFDIDTEEVYTMKEITDNLIWDLEMDIEPTEDVVLNDFIFPNLIQNGGCIAILNDYTNEIIKLLNDEGDEKEADRFLTQEERDSSMKDLYFNFMLDK